MKRLILFLVSAISAWAACPAPPFANGYSYCRMETVNHLLVPNTDQTNFPVPYYGLKPFLRSAANGGLVQSASGFDIIFTSDSAGATLLNWEQAVYTATTGYVEFYVQRTLTTASDTVFYVWYGKAGVVSSQSPGSPWDANFKAVYHCGTSSSLSVTDSTGVNNGTNHGATAGSGIAGGSCTFAAVSHQYIDIGADASINIAGAITIEAWINSTNANPNADCCQMAVTNWDGTDGYIMFNYLPGPELYFQAYKSSGLSSVRGATSTANRWAHMAVTYNNSTNGIEYINGTNFAQVNFGANKLGASSGGANIGRKPNNTGYWDGQLDEIRISNVDRPADWIKTEYNSYTYPTFVSEGAQVPAFTSAATCAGSVNGYTYCRPITIDHTKVGVNAAMPIGICIDATMGANCLTNNKELATVANGGKLTDAANGYDWIITSDAAGATPLNCERVIQNLTTGAAEIWCLPTLSTTADTTMYLWYANALVNTDQTHPTNVWTGYAGVYHFTALSGGISIAADSSSNGNNITSGSAIGASGQFGAGLDNSGALLYLNPVPAQFPTGSAGRTVEGWCNLTGSGGGGNAIISYGDTAADNERWTVWRTGGTLSRWQTEGFNGSGGAANFVNDNGWHYAVTELPSGTTWASVRTFFDGYPGINDSFTIGTINTQSTEVRLGGLAPGGGFPCPTIDEVRITSTVRSQAEILTEFYNLSNPSAFMVKGNEQSGSGKVRHRVTME